MAARIVQVGDNLANFRCRGRAVPGTQLRETTLARPYIIRCRVEPERVLILRVRHGAWRPR
jgi:toxin ParE1/3/4